MKYVSRTSIIFNCLIEFLFLSFKFVCSCLHVYVYNASFISEFDYGCRGFNKFQRKEILRKIFTPSITSARYGSGAYCVLLAYKWMIYSGTTKSHILKHFSLPLICVWIKVNGSHWIQGDLFSLKKWSWWGKHRRMPDGLTEISNQSGAGIVTHHSRTF